MSLPLNMHNLILLPARAVEQSKGVGRVDMACDHALRGR